MISLGSFVRPELAIDVDVPISQRELFATIADQIVAHGLGSNREALISAFSNREAAYPTCVGHGVALPHASTEAAASIAVAVVRLRTPIDWQACDGVPVTLAVAIVSPPDMRNRYLEVLSALARALHEEHVRRLVLCANSPAEAASIIANCAEPDQAGEGSSSDCRSD